MSDNAMVVRESGNLAPRTFSEAMQFAKLLCQSSFVPKEFRGKEGDILAAIQFGFELGVGPMQALQNIAVINGKPSVYGDLALALVQASGLLEYIEESDDGHKATCKVQRKGEPKPHVATFSDDDAKRASLFGKQGPWTQYPARMRMFRARGFALRDKFADVLKGLITREEAEDYPTPRASAESPSAGVSVATTATPVDESTGEVIGAQPPADIAHAMPADTDLATPAQRSAFWKMVQRAKGAAAASWLQNRGMELNGSPDGKKLTVGQIKQLTLMLTAPEEASQEPPPPADDDINASFEAEQAAQGK